MNFIKLQIKLYHLFLVLSFLLVGCGRNEETVPRKSLDDLIKKHQSALADAKEQNQKDLNKLKSDLKKEQELVLKSLADERSAEMLGIYNTVMVPLGASRISQWDRDHLKALENVLVISELKQKIQKDISQNIRGIELRDLSESQLKDFNENFLKITIVEDKTGKSWNGSGLLLTENG